MSELMDPSNQYDEGELERAKSVRGVEVSASFEYVMVFKMTSDGTTLAKRNEDSVIPNYASSVIKALLEAQLAFDVHLCQQNLPAVTQQFLIGQHGKRPREIRS
jgi:hypothetical protein